MKKLICLFAIACFAISMFACNPSTPNTPPTPPQPQTVMTWAEFMAAEPETEVVIEAYVQGKQSWWNDKCSVYLQDENGGYFVYELVCSEEDYSRLTVGTKIRVTGYKAEWAGLHEIAAGATFEIIEGNYIAKPIDLTNKLGSEELFNYQTMLVEFKGLTVVSVEYRDETPGDDIYVTLAYNGDEYEFCVERYLTAPETELYAKIGTLKEGDVVDIVGFAYWYEGINTHITSVTVK